MPGLNVMAFQDIYPEGHQSGVVIIQNGTRVSTNGRGENEPVASNDTDAGRQLNRRVEVAIYASEAYRDKVRKSYSGN